MDDQEARRILSEIGKLQSRLGSRNAAIAEWMDDQPDGKQRYNAACSHFGKIGRAKQKTSQMPLDAQQVVKDAEDEINFSALYRSVCEQFGWVPNDRMLATILNPNSGTRLFSAIRTNMREKGYVFTELPNKLGYAVKLDVNHKKKIAIQREIEIEAQRLVDSERRMKELRNQLAMVSGATS